MAITKNIGKNTLGDRNKMSVRLREYEMSTHDLSFVFRNTQSPGTLVPFVKLVAQKGDYPFIFFCITRSNLEYFFPVHCFIFHFLDF
jgi:hypothetical protein